MKQGCRQLKAAVYGLAVADALGVPVEFMKRGSFHVDDMVGFGTHNQPAGTWSDDTSMTLATCDSIKRCGGIDIADMQKRFRAWMNRGKYAINGNVFDIGGTTAMALRDGVGRKDEWSNGNGSLMRILPLAFTDATTEEIEAVSAITHAHPKSKAACVYYVQIIRELLNGKNLADILPKAEAPFDRLRDIGTLDATQIQSTGYVVSTLEAALWAVLTTDNFKDAVLKAVNLGSDTDTVGAVTGGIAGVLYGFEGIPAEWVHALRGKRLIDICLF